MSENLPSTPRETPKERAPRISKKVKAAIKALAAGEARTITQAAEKVGLSREHLSRELGKPHIKKLMIEFAERTIITAMPRAAVVKAELMESGNAMVADRASSFILGVGGIRPEATTRIPAGNNDTPGVVINIISAPTQKEPMQIDVTPALITP